jgi:hypothetical protein
MHVVAICGLKRSGKDTFARLLREANPSCTFEFVAFADALREVCSIAFGIPLNNFVSDELKDSPHESLPNGMTPRDALILVGTELFRKQVHPDIWIRAAIARIRRLQAADVVVVVTDVRFQNELEALQRNFDTTTILVVRGDAPQDPDALHETERFAARRAFPFDHVIHNDDSLEHLRRLAANLKIP